MKIIMITNDYPYFSNFPILGRIKTCLKRSDFSLTTTTIEVSEHFSLYNCEPNQSMN